MEFGLNETPAIQLLREQLLELLALARGGSADITRSKIPFSVFLCDFEVNEAALTEEHAETLAELAETLLTDPALEIDIVVGRASQTGTESNNLSLSTARAQAVLDELDELAIQPAPPMIGIGSSEPIANMPEEESDLNRSVEIRMWFDPTYHSSGPEGPASTSARPVGFEAYENAWANGFQTLTDQQLTELWTQLRQGSLNDFEHSRFHSYLAGTAVNLALEKGRRMGLGNSLQTQVFHAWKAVQHQLREDVDKADRTNTIYRDAERVLEVAHATLGGTAGGLSMVYAHLGYDPLKTIAWGIYDVSENDWALRKLATTSDYPSRAGGFDWTLLGFAYAQTHRHQSAPPSLPLPASVRELVQ